MKKSLAAVVLASMATTALAGAALVETQIEVEQDKFEKFYTIQFAADGSDIGRPGGYFYGVLRDGINVYFLGARGGWQQYKSGMLEGIDYLANLPREPRHYHPLTGALVTIPTNTTGRTLLGWTMNNSRPGATRQEICAKAGPTVVDFYAGIGALMPDKEDLVTNFHSVKNPRISSDHIRDMYLQNDMSQRGKVWKIGTFDCHPTLDQP